MMKTTLFMCFLSMAIVLGQACTATELQELVIAYQTGFEQDADGDGAADGWYRWKQLKDDQIDAAPSYRLESSDKVQGQYAQACTAPKKQGGIGILYAFESEMQYDVSIWVKVLRGSAVVQGHGGLSYFGWNDVNTDNAGQWTRLQKSLRSNRWSAAGGVIAFTDADDSEFLLDDFKVALVGPVEGRREPAPFPQHLRRVDVGTDKKLIEVGSSSPTIRWARDHVADIEAGPYDGLALRINYAFANMFFSRQRVADTAVEQAIEDLRATGFKKYTDNFIWCNTVPNEPSSSPDYHGNWYDDDRWDAINHNAHAAAKVAKQGGLKGIMFDTEHYHGRVFDYQKQKQKDEITYAEFAAKAHQRGREFMQAINRAYPDITIITMMAPSFVADDMWHDPSLKIEDCEFGLLFPFWDAMLATAAPGTVLIDGFERSYNFTTYHQFRRAYDLIKHDTPKLSADPQLYAQRTQAAIAIALPWHSADELAHSLHYAMHVTDRYVWCWSHADYNWSIGRAPRDRAAAVFNARKALDGGQRISADDLPARWHAEPPDYTGPWVKKGLTAHKVTRLGFVPQDRQPTTGQAQFPVISAAVDYNRTSIVLDLSQPRRVQAIHLTSMARRAGNVRFNADNLELYHSNDNQTYHKVSFSLSKLDDYTIQFADVDQTARYFKVHTTITDSSNNYQFNIGTGYPHQHSGATVFVAGSAN